MKNELYHHGVKGMRWGHRKEREYSGHRSSYHTNKTRLTPVQQSAKRQKDWNNSLEFWRQNSESRGNESRKAAEELRKRNHYNRAKKADKEADDWFTDAKTWADAQKEVMNTPVEECRGDNYYVSIAKKHVPYYEEWMSQFQV